MKYTEFRDQIQAELCLHPAGFTWVELRERLGLPYEHPCPTWVRRLEEEIGLVRIKASRQAYTWKLTDRQNG